MEYHVVSAKLNQEEHEKFLEFCNKKGLSTSAFIKKCISDQFETEEKDEQFLSMEELRKALRINK